MLWGGNEGIAFSAYLNHTISRMATGHTVKCDVALLNDGGVYNVYTDIFTVRKTGVYLFYFAIHSYHNNTALQVILTVDNKDIVGAALYTRDNEVDHDESVSNVVILRLSQGQSVWLAAYPSKHTLRNLPAQTIIGSCHSLVFSYIKEKGS